MAKKVTQADLMQMAPGETRVYDVAGYPDVLVARSAASRAGKMRSGRYSVSERGWKDGRVMVTFKG